MRTEPALVERLDVAQHDVERVRRLLDELAARYAGADDPEFVDHAAVLAHELPAVVRTFVTDMRLRERAPVFIVAMPDLVRTGVPPTPAHWRGQPAPSPTVRWEMSMVLLGSLLGDVFGWTTQQDGRLIHDVLPVRGQEHEQMGSGSLTQLSWHTEDAFHPNRADYIGLLCLRNPDRVATTVGTLRPRALDPEVVDVLFEPRFLIRPDNSHLPGNNAGDAAAGERFLRIQEMLSRPEPAAVLYGGREAPYLRIDPDFMEARPGDEEAARALRAAFSAIEAGLVDLTLEAGDHCFIDNHRVVHGRRSFRPRYDGQDRWLKRISVTRDLRRSRALRATAGTRLIG